MCEAKPNRTTQVAFRDKLDQENNKNKSVHFVLLAIYNGTLIPVPIAGIQVVVL